MVEEPVLTAIKRHPRRQLRGKNNEKPIGRAATMHKARRTNNVDAPPRSVSGEYALGSFRDHISGSS